MIMENTILEADRNATNTNGLLVLADIYHRDGGIPVIRIDNASV